MLVFALVTAGCASMGLPDPFTDTATGQTDVRLTVQNRNFADATVHILRGGERLRLGIVPGTLSEEYRIPWRLSMRMQVDVRLLAGERCVTREMIVDPGDDIYLEVPANVATDPDCNPGR
jgi:hypothetical protein